MPEGRGSGLLPPAPASGGAFRSLANANYRRWAMGGLVSNVGTWMQRTAQDWLVLTQLAPHNATSVGIVVALQFVPQIVLLPFTGYVADRFDRRRVMLTTQTISGLLALGLGLLTVTHMVQLWHVYAFALCLGCAASFDGPARQTFVSDVVGEADLANAVALNAASFNAGRLLGPAAAGLLIGMIGTGGVFLINAASYLAVIASLLSLRLPKATPLETTPHLRGGFSEGVIYVWQRPELLTALSILFLIGTFGMHFPIFISTMAVMVFHLGPSEFGFMTSMMAMGSITGALLAAKRVRPSFALLLKAAVLFGVGCATAAVMPSALSFGFALMLVGVAAQTLTTSTNSLVQLATEPAMRGRVLALLLACLMGGAPLGGPLVGWVADHFGPRWGLGVGAMAGGLAALVAAAYMLAQRRAQPPYNAATYSP